MFTARLRSARLLTSALFLLLLGATLPAATLPAAVAPAPPRSDEQATAAALERARASRPELVAFLDAMPKGGDLHNHLSGAVYGESWLHWATLAHLCVNASGKLLPPSSDNPPGAPSAASAACPAATEPVNERDDAQASSLLAAWSMRDFIPSAGNSGHDHFFATFGLFGLAGNGRTADELAEVMRRAARQHESYLELMLTPAGSATRELAASLPANTFPDTNAWPLDQDPNALTALPDFNRLAAELNAAGMPNVVAQARQDLSADLAHARQLLHCPATGPVDPASTSNLAACNVQVRFIYQVLRAQPANVVFTQLLLGALLQQPAPASNDSLVVGLNHDNLVVGFNMVQPEDAYVSMHDFPLHMRILAWLRTRYPRLNVSLHAGELAPGLVPPAGLRRHIRDSVLIAGAQRIGHGVDIGGELDAPALLRTMAARHTLVEICLSSNQGILGIEKSHHPLPLYLHAHVPVALATDDEGVSRSSLTQEFVKAEDDFHLPYPVLKQMVRASLEHSFAPGLSLWARPDTIKPVAACAGQTPGADRPTAPCAAFLAHSDKARLEWRLERDFRRFEHATATNPLWR